MSVPVQLMTVHQVGEVGLEYELVKGGGRKQTVVGKSKQSGFQRPGKLLAPAAALGPARRHAQQFILGDKFRAWGEPRKF